MAERNESVTSRAVVAVAFCPNPPALVPAVAQHADVELAELRAACSAAIRTVWAPGRQLVVIGAGPLTQRHASAARGTLVGFGVDLDFALGSSTPGGRVELPLSLTVGAWLLREALGPDTGAVGYSVSATERLGEAHGYPADAPISLVVMGDGSARRSTAAPGYLDERAQPFDAHLADRLRAGEGAGLQYSATDPAGIGPDLLASCLPAWDAAADLVAGRSWRATLHYDAAPYGVGYFVATWT